METEAAPIVVEQTFGAPVESLWKAITDKDQMRQWFFEAIHEFTPDPGFETQFSVHAEGRDFLHLWKVTEVILSKRIAYSWRYGGYPGDSFVVWEVSQADDGSRLKFTHTGHETFPQDDPVFSEEACRGAWDYFIRERLKAFLDGQVS